MLGSTPPSATLPATSNAWRLWRAWSPDGTRLATARSVHNKDALEVILNACPLGGRYGVDRPLAPSQRTPILGHVLGGVPDEEARTTRGFCGTFDGP